MAALRTFSVIQLVGRGGRIRLLSVWSRAYSNGTPFSSVPVAVSVRNGFPVLSLPLPSRRENCEFVVRPYLQTVGDFLIQLSNEDYGIENAALYNTEGTRIAKSTGMDLVLQSSFDILINGFKYRVDVPNNLPLSLDGEKSLSDVRNMIHKLYTSLNVEKHQLSKELELRGQLEQLKGELAPMEKLKLELDSRSTTQSNLAMWMGMGFTSLMFGFFARLTWWEYSWDIMEPVTYFWTYGTTMAMFAYFLITRQEYMYPDAQDRTYLNVFHRTAKRQSFDVDRYNHLKDAVANVEGELERLHDPLQLNLPTPAPDTTRQQ